MSIKENVFGSEKEREHYKELREKWSDEYAVYPNLPFTNLFTLTEAYQDLRTFQPLQLSYSETEALKAASVDYTLCDQRGKPILSIEFDGASDGFNMETKYLPRGGSEPSPNRWSMLELKLAIARGKGYPYFVLGGAEFDNLYGYTTIRKTVVDAIISKVLADRATRTAVTAFVKRIESGDMSDLGMSRAEYEALSDEEQQFHIQDTLDGLHVAAKMEHNRMAQLEERLRAELSIRSSGTGLVELHPSRENARRIKVVGHVTLNDGSKFDAHVWMPNFEDTGLETLMLLQDVAPVVAMLKAKHKLGSGV